MICRKCGEILDDHVKFCTACGAAQVSNIAASKLNPTHIGDADCAHEETHKPRKRRPRSFQIPMGIIPLLFLIVWGLLPYAPEPVEQSLSGSLRTVFVIVSIALPITIRLLRK